MSCKRSSHNTSHKITEHIHIHDDYPFLCQNIGLGSVSDLQRNTSQASVSTSTLSTAILVQLSLSIQHNTVQETDCPLAERCTFV